MNEIKIYTINNRRYYSYYSHIFSPNSIRTNKLRQGVGIINNRSQLPLRKR